MLSGKDESLKLSEPGLSQPVTTALQIALINLLRTWNIKPVVVVGHSSGEIAAAYCIGGLSFESALRVAYYRGAVATIVKDSSEEKMGMMSIGLSEPQASKVLDEHELQDELTIACVNSNSNVTVSGNMDAIKIENQLLQEDDTFSRILNVEVAYHSPYMLNACRTFESLIGDLVPGHSKDPSNIAMISTVSGQLISPADLCQASYWSCNLTSPVLFYQAMSGSMLSKQDQEIVTSIEHWIELGPHSALQGPIRQMKLRSGNGKEVGYSSVLHRNKEADITALELAGTLHCSGYHVNIQAVNNQENSKGYASGQMLTDLPPYPFNYDKSHWFESRMSRNYRLRQHPYNPYLGTRVLDWNPLQARWTNRISVASHPWLRDHKVSQLHWNRPGFARLQHP